MNHIIFLDPAEREMNEAAAFYERNADGLGEEFLNEVDRTTRLILESPKAGVVLKGHTRRRLLRRFPYGLLYRIESEQIVVVAVMHLRRRPNFWENRE